MNYSLAQAYLEQAKADFESYKLLKISDQPISQWLHFLQMSSEKAGKAYLAAYGSSSEQLRKSHLAFGRFIRILPRNKLLQRDWKISSEQLKQYLNQIHPIADRIERLAPALSNGPNAEYPWMLPDGEIRVPCTHDFKDIVSELESVRGRNLLKILERAISNSQWHKAFRIL